MRNRQQKELQRLEQALMEVDYTENYCDEPEEENDYDDYDDYGDYDDYDIYNTDDADVDLEAYSEDVHQGSSRSGLGVALTMLFMVALAAGILLLLKYLGVL